MGCFVIYVLINYGVRGSYVHDRSVECAGAACHDRSPFLAVRFLCVRVDPVGGDGRADDANC